MLLLLSAICHFSQFHMIKKVATLALRSVSWHSLKESVAIQLRSEIYDLLYFFSCQPMNIFCTVQPCYAVVDELLCGAVGAQEHPGFSHLTGCAECVLPPEQHSLQVYLQLQSQCSVYAHMYSVQVVYICPVFSVCENVWEMLKN